MVRSGLDALEETFGRPGRSAPTVQAAARSFVDALFTVAPRTTALARVLATLPFRDLPSEEHAFADRYAKAVGVRARLRPDTPVLALLATRGDREEWNDPRHSTRRVIPLTDPSFVRTIPMLSRMLEDVGFPVDTLGEGSAAGTRRLGEGMGVFHIHDAMAEENAHLIPERSFVMDHAIRSVFGLGSTYVDGSVLIVVVFSRDLVDRETIVRLAPLAAALKQRTYPAVAAGRIFDDEDSGIFPKGSG